MAAPVACQQAQHAQQEQGSASLLSRQQLQVAASLGWNRLLAGLHLPELLAQRPRCPRSNDKRAAGATTASAAAHS
jgi:hypothetical protein